MAEPKSVQRSFRLSGRTAELLDAAVASSGEPIDTLADRLLGEALRVERHPLIRFAAGAAGRRQPRLVGTRLDVRQVVATVRANSSTAASISRRAVQRGWLRSRPAPMSPVASARRAVI